MLRESMNNGVNKERNEESKYNLAAFFASLYTTTSLNDHLPTYLGVLEDVISTQYNFLKKFVK